MHHQETAPEAQREAPPQYLMDLYHRYHLVGGGWRKTS
jgi:hypothetical protein